MVAPVTWTTWGRRAPVASAWSRARRSEERGLVGLGARGRRAGRDGQHERAVPGIVDHDLGAARGGEAGHVERDSWSATWNRSWRSPASSSSRSLSTGPGQARLRTSISLTDTSG